MATYYCYSGATGLNNGLTQADAFTNLQSFLSIKGNSDICYLRGTQSLVAALTDTIALTHTTPAQIIGVDATWTETGERAIIDAQSVVNYCFQYSGGGSYLRWKNVEFTNPTSRCIYGSVSYNGNNFINCKFSNAATYSIHNMRRSTIFQCTFSGCSNTDLAGVDYSSVTSCIFIGGSIAWNAGGYSDLNLSILHDYSTAFIYPTTSIYINNCIADGAPNGFYTGFLSFSNLRITNITSVAISIGQSYGGNSYYGMYFYNPAGTDVGGANIGSILNAGYNRLTPANAGTGYANLAAHDFTLDPVTDLGVGVAIPIGWVNDTVNISYITSGIPPEFPSPATPTCLGITRFEPLTNGRFYVEWDAGTGTITSYSVYLRDGAAPIFNSTYRVKQVPYNAGINYTVLALEADQETLLRHGIDYYCSVRAVNGTSEDANVAVLNNLCSGAEGIQRQINTNFVIR